MASCRFIPLTISNHHHVTRDRGTWELTGGRSLYTDRGGGGGVCGWGVFNKWYCKRALIRNGEEGGP